MFLLTIISDDSLLPPQAVYVPVGGAECGLQAHTAEIAKILYRNTPPEALKSLETIEGHLRKQYIEIVHL